MNDIELKVWMAEADRRLRKQLAKTKDPKEQKVLKEMLKAKSKKPVL